MARVKKKPKKKPAKKESPANTTLKNRLRVRHLSEARAILSYAALTIPKGRYPDPPRYSAIALLLGCSEAGADRAEEAYSDANGPDEWCPDNEEYALDRVCDHLEFAKQECE